MTSSRPVPAVTLFLLVATALVGAARGDDDDQPTHTLHRFERRQLADVFTAEGAAVGDIDGDGAADIVSGPWWWKGPAFEARHAWTAETTFDPKAYSDKFFHHVHDVDGDGDGDIVTIGFPGKAATWAENPGGAKASAGPWSSHVALDRVDNESPTFTDLTGDGVPELVSHRGGRFGYASPGDDPRKPWPWIAVSASIDGLGAFTHGLGVGDVDGDGRADILWARGWLRQPPSSDGDRGDAPWEVHRFDFAPGARGGAQMLVTDLDGDGDADVVTSLDAHGWGLVWWEQRPAADGDEADAITFVRHDVWTDDPATSAGGVTVSQLHALALADLDGDGIDDVVTGKRYWAHGGRDPGATDPSALAWLRTVRDDAGGARFEPWLIDVDSGVGTQVTLADADADGLLDVVVGNKKGTFLLRHRTEKVTEEQWLRARTAQAVRRTPGGGLAPAAAAAAMTVPDGFAVDLIAGEPDLHQPIAFAIDERGRLFVAEAHTYPKRAPEGQGRDRIIILEDADDDGSFETRKVFAEKLNLVSGIEVGFGGVFVGAAPYLLFIPDRDGDDRPDGPPEVLLDGWGFQDTHETLNSFVWGPDGWLYGCHGVFTHSRVGAPGKAAAERTPINAGVWRYHPVRHRFEVFAWGTSNPWGVSFDATGEAFLTACVIPHLFHVVPGGRYQRQAGRHFSSHVYADIATAADHLHHAGERWTPQHARLADAHGGGHAHCGALVYEGDGFPEGYRGRLLMNNVHGNRVNADRLEPRGSGFVGRHEPDLLLANDEWFRGIALRTGPDGAVYLTDWYDPRACHSADPKAWDRSNGRLYRIRHGARRSMRLHDLAADRTSAQLAATAVEHDNAWHTATARRILQQRHGRPGDPSPGDRPVAPGRADAVAWLEAALADRERPATARLRALWALHAVDATPTDALLALTADPAADLRAWAVRLLAGRFADEAAPRLAELAREDPSPRVRREVASALQRVAPARRLAIAAALAGRAEDADDPNIPLLIWYGIMDVVADDPAAAAAIVEGARLPSIARFIVRRLAGDPARLGPVMTLLGGSKDDELRARLLDEIAVAWRGRPRVAKPPGWDEAFAALTRSGDGRIREGLRMLAVKVGDARVFPFLRRVLSDRAAPVERRLDALDVLVEGRDPDAIGVLIEALADSRLRRPVLRGLAQWSDARVPRAILLGWAGFTAEERADAAATLAARPASARALLSAVEDGSVGRREISAFTVRQLRALGDDEVNALLERAWGSARPTDADRQAEIEALMARLGPETLAEADLSTGRAVFARTCASCHTLFGAGDAIGPDLTGANRRDVAYLLENVLDPNAVVGRDYQLTVVLTDRGRLVSGLVTAEGEATITVRTATGDDVVIARDEIDQRKRDPASMMPEGLLRPFSETEVRDLIAYLGSAGQVPMRGRAAPIDPSTRRVAGVLEGEDLDVLQVGAGKAQRQEMAVFGRDRWSQNAQLWWTGAEPGARLVLTVPVARAGRYELEVALTRARDYGIVALELDGARLDAPIDLYDPRVVPTGSIALGAHELLAGDHHLAIEIVGANERAVKSFMVGVDWVRLVPLD